MSSKVLSPDGFRAIPEGGIKKSFWSYVEKVVGKCSLWSFFWRGAILTSFSMFPTVFGCVLRGKIYKFRTHEIVRKKLISNNALKTVVSQSRHMVSFISSTFCPDKSVHGDNLLLHQAKNPA